MNGKISLLRPQGYLLALEWPIDINHATHVLEAVADYTNPYMLNGLGMTSNLEMMDTQLFHN
jgi:hypothetical protein